MGFHEHMNTNERASNTLTYSTHNFSPLDSRTICLWNDPFVELSKSYTSGNVHQMHQIRFPTPPTTPPKEVKLSTYKIQIQQGSGQEQRTDSVIMKVGEAVSKIAQMNNIKVNDSVDFMTTSNSFICNWTQCKRTFANLETLATHVTKVHAIASAIDGLYYCGWDGCPRIDRGFNARYKMLVHVRTHTKEKPHQCNLCEKCFSRAENLKIHVRSHSGEKPYICSYEGCQKAYSNSSDRFKHTRTHSMEKPYFCKIPGCQKRYTDPSSLRKHVKTFKHSEQLINTDVHMPSTTSPISIETELLEKVRNDSSSEIYNGQCYIDLDPVEFCCLETNKLNYYYFDRKSAHPSYWISDDQNNTVQCSGHYTVENQTHSILDTTTESPLDLRINRIA